MSRRRAALLAPLLVVGITAPLLANGGTVRISRAEVGPYIVSVLTSPTPLRTGEVDVSVLVQDSAGAVLGDVAVRVEARPVGIEAEPVTHPATRAQATNKLFQAAKFDIGTPGEWEILVRVGGDEGGTVSFPVTVTEPSLLDRPYLLAALILLPLLLGGWLLSRRGNEEEEEAQSRIAATM